MLTEDEIAQNAATYFEQAGLIVDVSRAEVRGNAEWLGPMRMPDVLRLTSTSTVAQILDREDFATRYRDGHPISVVFPPSMEARVVETAPPMHSGQENTWKQARLENGVQIQVPLFIASGETVRIDLKTGRYLERVRGERKKGT